MNRRGFVGNLAAMLGAAAGPNILALEALDRFRWRAPVGSLISVINPEWVTAEYETAFIMDPNFCASFYKFVAENYDKFPVDGQVSVKRCHNPDPYTVRFRTREDALENKNPVAPFLVRLQSPS